MFMSFFLFESSWKRQLVFCKTLLNNALCCVSKPPPVTFYCRFLLEQDTSLLVGRAGRLPELYGLAKQWHALSLIWNCTPRLLIFCTIAFLLISICYTFFSFPNICNCKYCIVVFTMKRAHVGRFQSKTHPKGLNTSEQETLFNRRAC